MKRTLGSAIAVSALIAGMSSAYAAETVVVITSFPNSMTDPIEAASRRLIQDLIWKS